MAMEMYDGWYMGVHGPSRFRFQLRHEVHQNEWGRCWVEVSERVAKRLNRIACPNPHECDCGEYIAYKMDKNYWWVDLHEDGVHRGLRGGVDARARFDAED